MIQAHNADRKFIRYLSKAELSELALSHIHNLHGDAGADLEYSKAKEVRAYVRKCKAATK